MINDRFKIILEDGNYSQAPLVASLISRSLLGEINSIKLVIVHILRDKLVKEDY